MVRGLLNKLVSRSLSIAGKSQQQQLRRLNIHEYQVPLFPSLTSYLRLVLVDFCNFYEISLNSVY